MLSFGSIKIGPPSATRIDANSGEQVVEQVPKAESSRSLSDDDEEDPENSDEEDRSSLADEPIESQVEEAEKSSEEEIILSSNGGDPILADSPLLDPQLALQAGLAVVEEEDEVIEDPCQLKRQKTSSQACSINSETSAKVKEAAVEVVVDDEQFEPSEEVEVVQKEESAPVHVESAK